MKATLYAITFIVLASVAFATFNYDDELVGCGISLSAYANASDAQIRTFIQTQWSYNASDVDIDETFVSYPWRFSIIEDREAEEGNMELCWVSRPAVAQLPTPVVNYCLDNYDNETCNLYLLSNTVAFNATVDGVVYSVNPAQLQQWYTWSEAYYFMLDLQVRVRDYLAFQAVRWRIDSWLRSYG